METLTSVVLDTTFRNEENGYTVLRVGTSRSETTVVGILPRLSPGENVVFEGDWAEHPIYGRQFNAQTCQITQPVGKEAIEKYLGSGLIRGIGPSTAKLIVQEFGNKALEIMELHPEKLTEVKTIGPKKAAMIIESYNEQVSMRKTLVFLQKYGISPNLSMKIAKFYGDDTICLLRENPYRMVMDIEGVGFTTADRIALSMGINPASEFRIRAALFFLMQSAANNKGHTYLPRNLLLQTACDMLNIDEKVVDREITNAMLLKDLQGFCFDECDEAVCLPMYFYTEAEVARRLLKLMSYSPSKTITDVQAKIHNYEIQQNVVFGQKQKEAIQKSVEQGILVITGGPGTGKTTIIRCINHLMSGMKVLMCAPTGRAAKRITEATGQEAKTIHRLLEYSGEENDFLRNEDNPLEADSVIVDEVSMVDVRLMRSLLRAIMPGTRLILVGDSDQLPSVGAGNVLHDILESGKIPSVRLKDIFRQDESSMIVVNAHRINEGTMPILSSGSSDFFFMKRQIQSDVAKTISDLLYNRLPKYLGFGNNEQMKAIRSIQVLTPSKKSDCGSYALNVLLQNTINPRSGGTEYLIHGETEFRVGDKVIQTKNDYQAEYTYTNQNGQEEKGTGIFNGDIGYVESLNQEDHSLCVCFDDERHVVYQKQQLDALELAYCLTVHKSQGSEFEAVVIPVVSGPPMLMARNLLYTALTRAKRLVVLVGMPEIIKQMVDNNHIAKRYTMLKSRLMES